MTWNEDGYIIYQNWWKIKKEKLCQNNHVIEKKRKQKLRKKGYQRKKGNRNRKKRKIGDKRKMTSRL